MPTRKQTTIGTRLQQGLAWLIAGIAASIPLGMGLAFVIFLFWALTVSAH